MNHTSRLITLLIVAHAAPSLAQQAAPPVPAIPRPQGSPVVVERRRPRAVPYTPTGAAPTPFGIASPRVSPSGAAMRDFRAHLARSGHFGSGPGKTPMGADGVPGLTATIQMPTTSGVSIGFGGQSFGVTTSSGVMIGANPTWTSGGFPIGADPGTIRFDPATNRYYRISPHRDPALSSHYRPDDYEEQEPVAPPAPALEPFDQAARFLNARQYAAAAKVYEGMLKADEQNIDARVWLGVALVLDKKLEDGAAQLVGAYRDDPSLANEPLDFAGLPGITADSLRSAQAALANRARLAKSADCYAAAAIFAQARAKGPEALEFVKKAREAGLEPVFAGELVQRLQATR